MGRDKASLLIGGETLLDRARRHLQSACAQVVIAQRLALSTDTQRDPAPDATLRDAPQDDRPTPQQQVPDGPGRGPVAGILGAASAYPGQALLVLACDLPLMSAGLLRALMAKQGDWVVPRQGGRLQPLVALYRQPALSALAERVDQGRFSLHGLQDQHHLSTTIFTEEECRAFGDPQQLFLNVNTDDQLHEARRLASRWTT